MVLKIGNKIGDFEKDICYYFIYMYFNMGEFFFVWYIFNCVVNIVFFVMVIVFNLVIFFVICWILMFYILFGIFFFGLVFFDFGVGLIVYFLFFL